MNFKFGDNEVIINGSIWHAEFKPFYTPKEMLKMGIFSGKYMNDIFKFYPKKWATEAKVVEINKKGDPTLNYYGVKASLSLKEWRDKGWILTDSHGWFQWYCEYFLGRRIEEDLIQINRWKAFCKRMSNTKVKSDRVKQSLLHWSYNYQIKFGSESHQDSFKLFYENSKNEFVLNEKFLR